MPRLLRSFHDLRRRQDQAAETILDAAAEAKDLGVKEPVHWERVGKTVLLTLPEAAVKNPPCRYAWAFEITP